VFHRQHQVHGNQQRVSGKVRSRQTLPGPRAPHPKVLTVTLHPDGGMPLEAQVHVVHGDRHHWNDDLYYPDVGDVTGFIFDPGSGETWFDMSDPRNSMAAHIAAGDAWAHSPHNDEPTPVDTGPPWLVLDRCGSCGIPVDLKRAAMERQPQCMNCGQMLLAYPVVTRNLRRQALS